jgi:hypothetical protein
MPASLAAVLALAGLSVRVEAGDPPATTSPAPTEDALALGARYFDQAIAWVAKGGTLGTTRDFYAVLDANWDLPNEDGVVEHFEGQEIVLFASPDKMRTQRTYAAATTTKILDGEKAWVVLPTGAVQRVHGTPDAERTLKQMREDRLRIQDLTGFVTLEGLKGPGVTFEFVKAVTGSGEYAGRWLKLNRHSTQGRRMTFWLAYEDDGKGGVRATWPGVVRIEGDAAAGLWTEDWILKGWDDPAAKPRAYRYPSRIVGWRQPVDGSQRAQRFASLAVQDIQVNAGIDEASFVPPPPPPASEPKIK